MQPNRPSSVYPALRLEVAGLSLRRGGRALVDALDFTLTGGQALAVLGPNGAGKSSLLRAIAGLLPPTRGAARLALGGEPPCEVGPFAHYVGHAEGSKPALTARENLAFWAAMFAAPGFPGESDPAAALASVGVPQVADLPVAYLSAGQKRRVGLARLLLAPRPLWLLDEPLTALDAAGQAMLTGLMRDHLRRGGILIAATHASLGLSALELTLGEAVPA